MMGPTVRKRAKWCAAVVATLAVIGASATWQGLPPAVFISYLLVMFVNDTWTKTWTKRE